MIFPIDLVTIYKQKQYGRLIKFALPEIMRDLMAETTGMSVNELLKSYLCKCSLKL